MEIVTIQGRGFDSNVYIVKAARPIVVDTGTGLYAEETLRAIRASGVADEIETIVLTHRHCDHVGGAGFLAEALGAVLYASPLAVDALRNADPSTGALAFGVPLGPLEVEELGSEIDLGDARFAVIATPGHSSDSICLYSEVERTLVCGDTVFAGGGVGRWDLETGSYRELLASVEGLLELDVDNLYPGHGPEIEGGAHGQIRASLDYLRQWG